MWVTLSHPVMGVWPLNIRVRSRGRGRARARVGVRVSVIIGVSVSFSVGVRGDLFLHTHACQVELSGMRFNEGDMTIYGHNI